MGKASVEREGTEQPPSTSGLAEMSGLDSTAAAPTSDADVGAALRQAFRETVEEQVPDEMLDLLRRLC